jgi:hypothetical protein
VIDEVYAKRAKAPMDTQALLTAISAFVAFVGLTMALIIIAFKHQVRRSINRRAEATITQIQVEAGAVSSWWIVTAEWLDPQTGRILTFRSRRAILAGGVPAATSESKCHEPGKGVRKTDRSERERQHPSLSLPVRRKV